MRARVTPSLMRGAITTSLVRGAITTSLMRGAITCPSSCYTVTYARCHYMSKPAWTCNGTNIASCVLDLEVVAKERRKEVLDDLEVASCVLDLEVVAKERRKERRWLKSGGGLSIN